MYLKRLEIKGFKSFADNTELILNPGINIIVGPNGCGKSNIVDAIRWVLGEANVRHLRGSKSEDVIFNGTDTKKGLGMAQVEIGLDNSDHLLALDYNEITLNRKVFRNGESEFYINKSRVRMKDINNLFAGTGLGKKGYSIIGQGELEQVLNGQPLDRRLILEEASGLIKYRQQRDEVKRRLEKTGNDLLRLGDIIAEVQQRREELKHKADKAKKYIHLHQECKEIEKKVITSELLKAEQDLKNKNEEFQKLQNNIVSLSQLLSEQEAKLNEEEEKLKELQLQINNKQTEEYQAQKKLSMLQGEQRICTERIGNRQDRIKQSQADVTKYTEMLARLNKDLALKQEDYQRQEIDYQERAEEYKRLDCAIVKMKKELETMKNLFAQSKEEAFAKTREESQLKNSIIELEERLKKFNEKKERLLIRLDEFKNKIKQYNNDSQTLQSEIESYQVSYKDNEKELVELKEARKKWLEDLHKVEEVYACLNQDGIIINNNLLSIKQMNQNFSGYSVAVKSLMKANNSAKVKGILGIAGELIDVPQGLELAIEIAVGRGLENIITDTVENARQVIEFLKSNKLGRVTCLPLDILKTQKVPDKVLQQAHDCKGVIGLASQVVGFDPRYKTAIEYLLGRVLVVKDLNTAIYVFKQINYPFRMVSLEGDLVNVSGALTGGGKPATHNNSPLMRKAEEKRLLKQQEENNQAKDSTQKKLAIIQNELENLHNRIGKLNQQMLEDKMAMEIRQKQLNDNLAGLNKIMNEIGGMQQEVENLDKEIISITSDIILKQDKIEIIQAENGQALADLEKVRENLDVKKRDIEISQERCASLQEQLKMKRRELENIRKNTVQFEKIRYSYNQSFEEAKQTRMQMEELNHQEKLRYEELEGEIDKVKKSITLLAHEIDQIKILIDKINLNIKNLRHNIIPTREQVQNLEKQYRSQELAIARLETELSSYKIKWKEKFRDTFPINGEILSYGKMKESKFIVEELSSQLEAMGSVDTESIHEFEEINERFEFLNQQYYDLLQARDSLKSLLNETEKLMLKNFSQFLLMANQSFNNTFKAIFEGGEARLYMESKERLEAGVEIEVKLPGKRTQVLDLLSGGERALTCIAFIFSLLRLKPAPFCVLDEIDASLDEVNLMRFARFLREMADSMQFMVITHRQAIISIGENIYGITMPEKGISSILTLNLTEAEGLAG